MMARHAKSLHPPERRSIILLGPSVAIFAFLSSAEAGAMTPFVQEAQARGVVYAVQNFPWAYGADGYGCGFVDLDSDGDPDIVVMGALDRQVGLFENDGTGQFTDRSQGSGIPDLSEGSAFAAGDYDGDGLNDLYFTQWGLTAVLMRNDGNFQFTNVTAQAGVGSVGPGHGACFGDYDNDGRLDLYLCNYTGGIPGTDDIYNKLYHNLGDGTFEDVSVEQTVDSPGLSFQAVWFDYDRDGDVDLYLSNDRGHFPGNEPNQLWRNDDGQLVNVSAGSGADVGLFSMGLACGDFDGNRWPDLYVTNLAGYPNGYNPLLLNQGDGTFIEWSDEAGVDNWKSSWGAVFFDFDNNGQQDLYVNNQWVANSLYACDGPYPCQDVASTLHVASTHGLCPPYDFNCHPSYSSAVGDVDDDGDLDLLVNNLGVNVELFINYEGQTRNWIKYRMIGQGTNIFAVGGNVDTRTGSTWRFREILAGGNGYKGQNELTLHVGLNDATIIDEVVASWPGGLSTRTLTNLPVNQTYPLYPPERLGDSDQDGDVDLDDVDDFVDALLGGSAGIDQFALSDLNGDSSLNGLDVRLFVQALVGAPPPTPQGDIDGDGVVDEADIAVFVAVMLGSDSDPAHVTSSDLNQDTLLNGQDVVLFAQVLLGSR